MPSGTKTCYLCHISLLSITCYHKVAFERGLGDLIVRRKQYCQGTGIIKNGHVHRSKFTPESCIITLAIQASIQLHGLWRIMPRLALFHGPRLFKSLLHTAQQNLTWTSGRQNIILHRSPNLAMNFYEASTFLSIDTSPFKKTSIFSLLVLNNWLNH